MCNVEEILLKIIKFVCSTRTVNKFLFDWEFIIMKCIITVGNQMKVTKILTHAGNGVVVGKAVCIQTLKRKAEESEDCHGRNVLPN